MYFYKEQIYVFISTECMLMRQSKTWLATLSSYLCSLYLFYSQLGSRVMHVRNKKHLNLVIKSLQSYVQIVLVVAHDYSLNMSIIIMYNHSSTSLYFHLKIYILHQNPIRNFVISTIFITSIYGH